MVSRRGSTTSGCLTSLLLLAALVYVGSRIGEPYFRYFQFRDAVKQEARFATLRTDDAIRKNLWANADSLALPEDAYHLRIKRTPRLIIISANYDDEWSISSYTRPVHFDLRIENPL